ncbi:hypothetical protein LCGC14_0340060 [marine sediment metagenome]|uniref:Uncharacterized protein n=1 Tax=marine sediment metagenome TaxID=412755 RepID=A0A0F9TJK1_9ZZZZ|nr:hypothetical protein [Phycisphaerae bacterium]HDZ44565.1 hypothetical protein [Phycisphaerae bacterium]
MAVVVGIDEAGLGPVLGPLVVSGVAISVPDDARDTSLWELLAPAVSRKRSDKTAVAVNDSKKLYSGRAGRSLHHLERGVLAMLAAAGHHPRRLSELLALVAPGAGEQRGRYPWYAGADLDLPRSVDATDVALAGNAVKRAMSTAGVKLVGVRAEPVFVGEYNQLVAATRNKSTTAFDVTSRLLVWAWGRPGGDNVDVYVDRLGGRQRYRRCLQRVFEGCHLKVLAETESCSSYAISRGPCRLRVSFEVGQDAKAFAAALASMLSKYLRELFMETLNGFWARHVPQLEPTAGYYVDGRRFYAAIQPAMAQLGVDERLVYRTR